MECNIVADGIVVFGVLTPWSDVRSIVLAHEPAVVVGDAIVSEAYCQIVVELVTGDVIEIPESSPGWSHAVEHLRHLCGVPNCGPGTGSLEVTTLAARREPQPDRPRLGSAP